MDVKNVIIGMLLFPLLAGAQDSSTGNQFKEKNEGVQFVQGLSWEQVLAKAKAENKYIFMDCFATWCGPCRQMDKYTYTDPKVSQFFNKHFISVRVQMNVTKDDDSQVRNWYGTAKDIQKQYAVASYPTLLFFSPEGRPLHKVAAGYNATAFLALGNDVFDPGKQYYRLLANFKPGQMDTAEMKAKALGLLGSGNELAEKIAMDYLSRIPKKELSSWENLKFIENFNTNPEIQKLAVKYIEGLNKRDMQDSLNMIFMLVFRNVARVHEIANDYISQLKMKDIRTSRALDFIRHFSRNVQSPGFKIFLQNTRIIDSIYQDSDNAEFFVSSMIANEEIIKPILMPGSKKDGFLPDWENIRIENAKKYGQQYSDRAILTAKEVWYAHKKEWSEYCHLLVNRLNSFAEYWIKKDENALNHNCWLIFLHSKDTADLQRAAYWMQHLFDKEPHWLHSGAELDTYANLLYKLGRTKEALEWEAEAVKWDLGMKETYEKMKKGVPTWPQD